VNIGGMPAARAGDAATCSGAPDTIVQGSPTVFIDGRPAVRVGDSCAHSGLIVVGCATVNIGGTGGGAGDSSGVPGGTSKRPLRGGTSGSSQKPNGTGAEGAPKKTETKGQSAQGGGASPPSGKSGEAPATLFGRPVSMEVIRALLRLAQQLVPGLAARVPPIDPAAFASLLAEIRAAIARKDVESVNALSAKLTALMQQGPPAAAPPTPGGRPPQGSAATAGAENDR
jgi:hypothetical protein